MGKISRKFHLTIRTGKNKQNNNKQIRKFPHKRPVLQKEKEMHTKNISSVKNG